MYVGEKLAVAHLDAEQYSATTDALRELAPCVAARCSSWTNSSTLTGTSSTSGRRCSRPRTSSARIAQSGELKLVVENEMAET
jgi:hypothetical protein